MAYATAEERHDKQRRHEGSFSVEQKLQSYLRDKYTPESVSEATVSELAQVASDYDAEIGVRQYPEYYRDMALEAIKTFKRNWKDKTPGEDDRGGRFGQAQDGADTWRTVSTAIQDMRW